MPRSCPPERSRSTTAHRTVRAGSSGASCGCWQKAYAKQGRAADAQAALARRAGHRAGRLGAVRDRARPVPTEIITTDLKRLRTHDCGVVSFKVDDAPALLFNFESFALVQLRIRLDINSAMRRIVGSRSSAQVLGEADQIGRELAASLDDLAIGYAVRATPGDIALLPRMNIPRRPDPKASSWSDRASLEVLRPQPPKVASAPVTVAPSGGPSG